MQVLQQARYIYKLRECLLQIYKRAQPPSYTKKQVSYKKCLGLFICRLRPGSWITIILQPAQQQSSSSAHGYFARIFYIIIRIFIAIQIVRSFRLGSRIYTIVLKIVEVVLAGFCISLIRVAFSQLQGSCYGSESVRAAIARS